MQGEKNVLVARHTGVQGIPSQQGRLGHRAVSRFQQQGIVVHPHNGLRDLLRVHPDFRNAVHFLDQDAGRRQGAVSTEDYQLGMLIRQRHGQRPDEAPGPFQRLPEIGFQGLQVRFTFRGAVITGQYAGAGVLVEDRPLEAAPHVHVEYVAVQRRAFSGHDPVSNGMGQQLEHARHGHQDLGIDFPETHLDPVDKSVQYFNRAQAGGTQQDDAPDPFPAIHIHREFIAVQHVGAPVTDIVAGDQAAHTVRDDIDLQVRIAMVQPDAVDEIRQVCRIDRVIQAPVVIKLVEIF